MADLRPDSLKRITDPTAAKAFIDDQIKAIKTKLLTLDMFLFN